MEWSGTVDHRYPAYDSDLRTPPFCGNPPPPNGMWLGMEMVIRQSCRITCLSGHLGGGRSSDTQESLFVSFDSLLTVLRSNRGFVWIWIGIRFWEVVLTDTESSPFSSPIITISHHLWGISPFVQTWSESKFVCFFNMVLSIFIGFCNGPALDFPFLISLQFCNENIFLKANTG